MKTVEVLYKEAQNLPTVMEIDQELKLMKDLENLDINDIEKNKSEVEEIMDLLCESHADVYDEVDESNSEQVKSFLKWLEKIGNETSLRKGFIDSMIDMFSINVK